MKFIIPIALSLILTSCLTVSFNQPQPKDGHRLEEFPEKLRGKWILDNGDSIIIEATGIRTSKLKVDSLNNIIDTSYMYTTLSDSLRIYEARKYYIFNERSSNGSWTFVLTKVDFRGNIYYYLCDDFKFYSRLKGLKVDSASYLIQHYLPDIDELITQDTLVYNPTAKELSKVNNDEMHWIYFNGQIRVSDLQKIAVRKNLTSIYKVDGTIEEKKSDPDEGSALH